MQGSDPRDETAAISKLSLGNAPWFECFVAEINAEFVGFASFGRRFEVHTRAQTLRLGDLVVAKAHRDKGIGQYLIHALARRAADLGCEAIVLELRSGNMAARAFYIRVSSADDAVIETRQTGASWP